MRSPKITRVDIYKTSYEFTTPFRIALGLVTKGEGLAVQIHTDLGLVGVGEGTPYWFITGETQAICYEAAKTIAKLLIGKNPLAIEARMQEINAYIVHNTTTKNAFDMALHDLLGKQAGMPLYALLGGEKIDIYTNSTIGINTPAEMVKQAACYIDQGVWGLKIKLGTTLQEDVERIRSIREFVGDELPIRIDANQGWNLVTAIEILHELSNFNVDFCEEPIAHWNIRDLKRVRDESPIPIMADECLFDHHDAFRLADMAACDFFNIKLAKSGGIHTALKINAVAEAAGIPCMVGGMFETRVGISASAHLIAARKNIKFADLDSINHHVNDPVIGGVTFTGGKVSLPEEPGLGAEFDPAFLDEIEMITIS